jgi:hypothetical protein
VGFGVAVSRGSGARKYRIGKDGDAQRGEWKGYQTAIAHHENAVRLLR